MYMVRRNGIALGDDGHVATLELRVIVLTEVRSDSVLSCYPTPRQPQSPRPPQVPSFGMCLR